MKLVPVDRVPGIKVGYYHNLVEIVKDFLTSKHDVCEVDITEHDYKKPIYCYKGLQQCIRRMGVPVKAMYRNGKTYLVRVEI